MRNYLANLIASDPVLAAAGLPAGAVYSAENVDTPDVTQPFIVIRWTDRSGGFRASRSQPNMMDVWCYDKRGDYTRIDVILSRLRTIMENVRAVPTETGWITQADWQGDGADAYDDVWKAIVRTATYRVVASYTAR